MSETEPPACEYCSQDVTIKQLRAVLGGMRMGQQGEIWRFRAEVAEVRVKELEAQLAASK